MKIRILLIASCLFLASCMNEKDLGEPAVNLPSDGKEYNIPDEYAVQGVVQIRLKEDPALAEEDLTITKTKSGFVSTGIPELDDIIVQLGATSMKRTFSHGGEYEKVMRYDGLHLWYDVYFDESIPVTRAVKSFRELDIIDIAEAAPQIVLFDAVPAAPLFPGMIPAGSNDVYADTDRDENYPFDDPMWRTQWHYNNTGTRMSIDIEGADINLWKAWEIETGHPSVIVSVVDGGIDFNHNDLRANMWTSSEGYYGRNFVDNSNTIVAHDHGTHVAGTVAAVNNNGVGVAGVAGGSGPGTGARLMSCQVFGPNETQASSSGFGDAIIWGANNGAVISQNSWGNRWSGSDQTVNAAQKAAIDYFVKRAGTDPDDVTGETQREGSPMKGGIVIFAAGNSYLDNRVAMPGAYEKCFAVAAMASNYKRATYSNVGSWVDISAPGGDQNTYGYNYGVYSTLPSNRYDYYQGTSMACPHVSGVAALVVSRFGTSGPGFTNDQLWTILENSVNDIYTYNSGMNAGWMGSGYIDAYKAVTYGGLGGNLPPYVVNNMQAEWSLTGVSLTWTVSGDMEDGKATKYEILYSENDLAGADFENPPAGATKETVEVGSKSLGDPMELIIAGLTPHNQYYVSISALDSEGLRSGARMLSGRTLREMPEITDFNVAWRLRAADLTWSVVGNQYGKINTYEIFYADRSLDDLNFESPATWVTKQTVTAGEKTVGSPLSYTIPSLTPDKEYWVVISGLDEDYGYRTTKIMKNGKTLKNNAPVVSTPLQNEYFTSNTGSFQVTLKDHFTDDIDTDLRYSISSSNPQVVSAGTINPTTTAVTFTVNSYGASTITITAIDSENARVAGSFQVMARNGNETVELYPNPVSSVMNVRMGEDVNGAIDVAIHNSAGTKVLETKANISAYVPAEIDLSKLTGGNYTVSVKYNGQETKKSITKL